MRWTDGLGRALAYIEQNLEGEIDHARAAQLCCCSQGKFRSLFQLVTDMTLSEYIRRRRMSLCMQNKTVK